VLQSAHHDRRARAAIERVIAVEDGQGVPAARAYIECLLASPLLALI
jgi:hypothetical protein